MSFQNSKYLVETEWLQQHLHDPDLRILDCTVYPPNYFEESSAKKVEIVPGREDYQKGHIPGSAYVDLVGELTDAGNKRFMFPMHPQSNLPKPCPGTALGMERASCCTTAC
jgi:thiosulfate/3-mercaptopyruvate sulfurtransferase